MMPWQTQDQPKPLGKDEAHVWIAPLATSPEKLSFFRTILSMDEGERAGRFRKSIDGERYVVARGLLRSLLGGYLATAPRQLDFAYDDLGKPVLAGQPEEGVLHFNVSHSGDRALFGFARGRRIGVDLEWVSPDLEIFELAQRYLSPDEFWRWRCLPPSEQREAFYCAWTRKEAYLKACARGLSFGPERVEVSFSRDERAAIRKVAGAPDISTHWTLEHLSPDPNYLGAAAVEGTGVKFSLIAWQPA